MQKIQIEWKCWEYKYLYSSVNFVSVFSKIWLRLEVFGRKFRILCITLKSCTFSWDFVVILFFCVVACLYLASFSVCCYAFAVLFGNCLLCISFSLLLLQVFFAVSITYLDWFLPNFGLWDIWGQNLNCKWTSARHLFARPYTIQPFLVPMPENCFLTVIGSCMLAFQYRQYGRLTLATAGFLEYCISQQVDHVCLVVLRARSYVRTRRFLKTWELGTSKHHRSRSMVRSCHIITTNWFVRHLYCLYSRSDCYILLIINEE